MSKCREAEAGKKTLKKTFLLIKQNTYILLDSGAQEKKKNIT